MQQVIVQVHIDPDDEFGVSVTTDNGTLYDLSDLSIIEGNGEGFAHVGADHADSLTIRTAGVLAYQANTGQIDGKQFFNLASYLGITQRNF